MVLLAIRQRGEELRICVHPNLKKFIEDVDREYVDSLLQDLRERSGLDPDGLFEHLCSLSVGPLVTCEIGDEIAGREYLSRCLADFPEI